MLTVSDETKAAFMRDGSHKTLRLVFPELNLEITNDRIVKDSLSLSEGISTDSNFEFVGCISSSLKIKIYNINNKLKGKKIELYIKADDTEEIPLFKGIVDSATIQAERAFKEIEAYDNLYTIGQKDVASWYNSLTYPTTIGAIRKSLFTKIGLNAVDCKLPNDDIVIPKKVFEKIETLQALVVIKSICQINGCFGIQNRSGKFEFRYLSGAYDRIFPGTDMYPSSDLYPVTDPVKAGNVIGYFDFESYKSIEFEEFEVKPVQKIQIRDAEEYKGVTYGSGTNKYIIQSNMFAYELPEADLTTIAKNIHKNIKNVSYHPCNIENLGLPFLECGDVISYKIVRHYGDTGNYNVNTFIILSRTLKGEQLLFDTYVSEGEEEQKEFITDIQSQLNALKQNPDDYYTADEIDDMMEEIPDEAEVMDMISDQVNDMEMATGWTVKSVNSLPVNKSPDTIYFIRGGMIII